MYKVKTGNRSTGKEGEEKRRSLIPSTGIAKDRWRMITGRRRQVRQTGKETRTRIGIGTTRIGR